MKLIVVLDIQTNKLSDYQIIPICMGKNRMEVGNISVLNAIRRYSQFLNISKDEYILQRQILINNYIQERKNLRNFKWYFKQLNWNTICMILNSPNNSKKYLLNIKKYL